MIVAPDCNRSEDRRVRVAKNDHLTGLDFPVVRTTVTVQASRFLSNASDPRSAKIEDINDRSTAIRQIKKFVSESTADELPVVLLVDLDVTLLGLAPNNILRQKSDSLDRTQVRITGGPRSRPVRILEAGIQRIEDDPYDPRDDRDDILRCKLQIELPNPIPDSMAGLGILDAYKFEVIEVDDSGQPTGRSHPAFDQFFSSIDFRFSQGNATQNDCRRLPRLPEPRRPSPEINYLAKDYESFRQLILDRLSTVMPQWRDRSPADVGITLVEILAHMGDQLSYYQDAVATEAYLNTARQRISVRRHVRLVDYFMHEGCNARAFVLIKPEEDLPEALASQLGFATQPDVGRDIETRVVGNRGGANTPEVFEPLIETATPLRITINDLKDPSSLAGDLQGKLPARFKAEIAEAFQIRQMPGRLRESVDQHETQQEATLELPQYIWAKLSDDEQESLTEDDPQNLQADELQDLWLHLLRRAIIRLISRPVDPPQLLLRKLFNEFVNTAIRSRLSQTTLSLLEQYDRIGPPYDRIGPPSPALELALADELNAVLQSSYIRDVLFRPAVLEPRIPKWLHVRSLRDTFADASVEDMQKVANALGKLGVHLPSLLFDNPNSEKIALAPDQLDDRAIVEWNYRLLEDAFPSQIARRRQLAAGLRFFAAHNCMQFHTWGSRTFVLHAGSTTAAIVDEGLANLQPGEVLIFEEVNNPVTGNPSDADIAKRHAVRLTRVRFEYDRALTDADYPSGRPIVRIWWRSEDALPFDLCVAAVGPARRNCDLLCNISVARGNVVFVDHGQQLRRTDVNRNGVIVLGQAESKRVYEDLGHVPIMETGPECEAESTPGEVALKPGRFNPKLNERPVVFSEPIAFNLPAVRFFAQDPRGALPGIDLRSIPPAPGGVGSLFTPAQLENPREIAEKLLDDDLDIYDRTLLGRLPEVVKYLADDGDNEKDLTRLLKTELPTLLRQWEPRRDLFASQDNDRHYVVEIDNDDFAHLRFGDGDLGRRPEAGEHFIASYRIADPANGNVGADTITDLRERPKAWKGKKIEVTNPLPALGGRPPESMAEVRQLAPHAIRGRLQRAIIPEDYAQLVNQHFADRIQRAIAQRRWTGSWEEILVTVDPLDRIEPDPALLAEIHGLLYRFRRIGHDVVVTAPIYVPLRIGIDVFVTAGFQFDHVREDVLQALSIEVLPDGRLGFFHPDRLSFGHGVFLSRLIEAAGQVTGVEFVNVTTFERFFEGDNGELADGIIRLGPREIARLDSDPDYPEHGVLQLRLCEANE